MNELDLKLCEMFPSENKKQMTENIYEIGIPQLHDVFRVAEDNVLVCELAISSYTDDYKLMFSRGNKTVKSLYYNPTLPLMSQSEQTKQSLISLFE